MKFAKIFALPGLFLLVMLFGCKEKNEEWISLFNGKDLTGWKSSEDPTSFYVEDGLIIANGARSHLFYSGDGGEVEFKNFELSVDIMTTHHANSGVYIHTKWQDEGWPSFGYEAQINNSHIGEGDYIELKKTGSLYGIRNVYKAFAKDSVWFTMKVRVDGHQIKIWVDDMLTVDYVEPQNPHRREGSTGGRLSSGTIALQCHDPGSKVFFKNIRLKKLPDISSSEREIPEDNYPKVLDLQFQNFPLIDMVVETDGNFNADSALNVFYQSGINWGFVVDLSEADSSIVDQLLTSHIQSYQDYPVFIGAKISGPVSNTTFSRAEKLDYVIGEVMIDSISKYNDMEKYTDDLVKDRIDLILNTGIDIISNATLLPEELSSQSEDLWTSDRMMKIIEACKANEVAIEINNELKSPGFTFIKLAKEYGCQFVCGKISNKNGRAEMDYFYEMIEKAELNYKDIFIPGYE